MKTIEIDDLTKSAKILSHDRVRKEEMQDKGLLMKTVTCILNY